LPRIVAATKPGSEVGVLLWRKGSTLKVSIIVGEIQDAAGKQARDNQGGDTPSQSIARLGLNVTELNDEQKAELQVGGGLLVLEAKGAAARADLQRGDVILAIGNIEILNVKQFNEILKQVAPGRNIALLVRRNDGTMYIPLKVDDK